MKRLSPEDFEGVDLKLKGPIGVLSQGLRVEDPKDMMTALNLPKKNQT